MDSNDPESESIRPEELLEGIRANSMQIFSQEELTEFLDEWSEKECFVEDIGRVADPVKRGEVSPEEIFEYLASSEQEYRVEEMLDIVESLTDQEWTAFPEVSSTGGLTQIDFGHKACAPREKNYIPLSGGYIGESSFWEDGRRIWLQQHEDGWYQTGVEPLDQDEVKDIMEALEKIAPALCLHEADYGSETYLVDSQDLDFYFDAPEMFHDSKELYRIDSDFRDFVFEATRRPEEGYAATIFSGNGETYPVESYGEVFSEQLVNGLQTKIILNSFEVS